MDKPSSVSRSRGPKPPNQSKLLAKMITNPRHAAARALAVHVATEAAALAPQDHAPVVLGPPEGNIKIPQWQNEAASYLSVDHAAPPQGTKAASSYPSPPGALNGWASSDGHVCDRSAPHQYYGSAASMSDELHHQPGPSATASTSNQRVSLPVLQPVPASESSGFAIESRNVFRSDLDLRQPSAEVVAHGADSLAHVQPHVTESEAALPLSDITVEQGCSSIEEQERFVRERTCHFQPVNPEDERDAEEIDLSLSSIQPRCPSLRRREASFKGFNIALSSASNGVAASEANVQGDASDDRLPARGPATEFESDRAEDPIALESDLNDLTSASSPDPSVASDFLDPSKRSVAGAVGCREAKHIHAHKDKEQRRDMDPWLLSRAMLRRPLLPHRPEGQRGRLPSSALRGPMAKAMAKSGLPNQNFSTGNAMSRVSAIGAQTMRRTISTTLPSAPAQTAATPVPSPNFSFRPSSRTSTGCGARVNS